MAVLQNTILPGRLAVIVINWNNARDTIRCLEYLTSWFRVRPAVYVVDNASTDGSLREVERLFTDIRIIRNKKNLGFAGGNNIAIKKAMADGAQEILLLNNDAIVAEADVAGMLHRLAGLPAVGVIGPRLRVGTAVLAGGSDIGLRADTHIHWEPAMGVDGIKKVDYVPGTVFLVRRGAIEKVGLLDEDYFFSGEAADLCKRIHDAGMGCCIDLAAEAVHLADHSGKRGLLYSYYSMRNRFLYVQKHHRGRKLLLYCMWVRYFLCDIARTLVRGDLARSRAIVLALFDGLTRGFGDHNDRFID